MCIEVSWSSFNTNYFSGELRLHRAVLSQKKNAIISQLNRVERKIFFVALGVDNCRSIKDSQSFVGVNHMGLHQKNNRKNKRQNKNQKQNKRISIFLFDTIIHQIKESLPYDQKLLQV